MNSDETQNDTELLTGGFVGANKLKVEKPKPKADSKKDNGSKPQTEENGSGSNSDKPNT